MSSLRNCSIDSHERFPLSASVVIPFRPRAHTISINIERLINIHYIVLLPSFHMPMDVIYGTVGNEGIFMDPKGSHVCCKKEAKATCV